MQQSSAAGRSFLDPAILARIGNLELIAKFVVEGFISGLHKSPYHGFSVEFSQYRQYMPGDDTKHIDWKAYARTDLLDKRRALMDAWAAFVMDGLEGSGEDGNR